MADFFAGFGLASLPDAIAALQYRVHEKESPAGIERYALRLFDELDLDRLRSITDENRVSLVRISRVDSFYINFDRSAIVADDALLLYQTETVLNRLSKVNGLVEGAPALEEDCAILDDYAFQQVTSAVAKIVATAGQPNRLDQLGTVSCERGGEWDVRTRFATTCESVSPITHMDYAFACDVERGEFFVSFTRPDESAMPHSACDRVTGRWRRIGSLERAELAREHACRLSLVLAAAAFSAGTAIQRVVVQAYGGAGSADSFAHAFTRTPFFASGVPLASELVGTSLAYSPCAEAIQPLAVTVVDADSWHSLFAEEIPPRKRFAPLPSAADRRLVVPAEDRRIFPRGVRERVRAERPCELDVSVSKDHGLSERYNEIQPLLSEDPIRAEQELMTYIAELEAAAAIAELEADGPVQLQFFERPLDRLLVPLLEERPDVRFLSVPADLFYAQFELASLYIRQGRLEEALVEAHHLLDLGATSARAHYLLVNVLFHLERYDEIVEVCHHGMRVAYDRDVIAYYFYRLAFAYWNLHEYRLAAACYVMVPDGQQVSEMAKIELRALLSRAQIDEAPSRAVAVETLQAAGVPIPPTKAVVEQVADCTVLLADNGFFSAACGYLGMILQVVSSDELAAVRRSFMPFNVQLEFISGGQRQDGDEERESSDGEGESSEANK